MGCQSTKPQILPTQTLPLKQKNDSKTEFLSKNPIIQKPPKSVWQSQRLEDKERKKDRTSSAARPAVQVLVKKTPTSGYQPAALGRLENDQKSLSQEKQQISASPAIVAKTNAPSQKPAFVIVANCGSDSEGQAKTRDSFKNPSKEEPKRKGLTKGPIEEESLTLERNSLISVRSKSDQEDSILKSPASEMEHNNALHQQIKNVLEFSHSVQISQGSQVRESSMAIKEAASAKIPKKLVNREARVNRVRSRLRDLKL